MSKNQKYSNEQLEEINNVLSNAKPDSRMNLEYTQREKIYQQSKHLNFSEKADLLICFITYPGTTLYDPGRLLEAQIRIDDKNSKASENRPLAYIETTDGYYSRVEVIDIIESVKSNAINIGHPAIVFAVHHWQKILRWAKFNESDDINSGDDFYKELSFELTGKYIESARSNLEAVGKALLEGARRNIIPKESALVLKIDELNLDKNNSYLRIAWNRLSSKHINQTHNLEERIAEIKQFLTDLPAFPHQDQLSKIPPNLQYLEYFDSTIGIAEIIDFLKNDGNKFVYDEESHHSKRPQWKVFRNAFISYYFQKEASTIEQYKKIARNQTIDEQPYFIGKDSMSPSINTYHLLSYVFTQSLVSLCEPIECETDIVNSSEFFKLVDQRVIK